MLILNPHLVRFGGSPWPNVTSIIIDRTAEVLIEDRGEKGPFATFIDVARQRVSIRLTQSLASDDLADPASGEEGGLEVWLSPNASHADRRKLSVSVVVASVRHEIVNRAARREGQSAIRTITMLAYSNDGKIDPIEVVPADSGPD